jgi:hypothetical protein
MKAKGGRGIVEKDKSRRGVEKSREKEIMNVEYSTISFKVVATFIIIFRM